MKIAIIGYGVEGRAAYDYWRGDNELTICDKNAALEVPDDVTAQFGDNYLDGLEDFDLIVRSPHVRPDLLVNAASTDILPKITSNTNEFLRVCPSRNIIGVTGTKGKGTTSSLITAMLQAAGKTVHLGGNIGIAALDLLKKDIQPDDFVVLELSNFQLVDLRQSPHMAVCLMIAPEHLDWHIDAEEYYAAKQQLFRWQTEADVAVYYGANDHSTMIASAGTARKIPYFEAPGAEVIDGVISIDGTAICPVSELKLLGKHNWQNACAATTLVWQITQDVAALHSALSSFSGLEHRLELVRELDDVRYYDDSFGTTPETAIVAIEAFEVPKVIVLGGSDKGADYGGLAHSVATGNVRSALLIGDQADRLQRALDNAGFTDYQPGGSTMTDIVALAQRVSQPGDVVLLSTGCASFGMFKNYKDRGNQFTAAVQGLAATVQSPAAPAA